MTGFIWFIIGLFIGDAIGVVTIALTRAARDADKKAENLQTMTPPEHVNCRCWASPLDDRVREFSECKDESPRDESNDQSPTE